MNFDLSPDQEMFRDTVERFLAPVDVAARRRLRAEAGAYPAGRWGNLCDLGLIALAAPEDKGGLGGSRIDLALVAEAMGRGLAIDPWLECGVLPVRLAAAAGDDALVEQVVTGATRATLAFAEPGRRYNLQPTLRASDDGKLNGAKTFVLGGMSADAWLVTAAQSDGFGVYLISADDERLARRGYQLVDGSVAADAQLFDVPGTRLAVSFDAFTQVIGDARLLAAAEMLGLAQRLFEDTLAYVKQREQFGVAIASFQALQHRLVDGYAELELARSLVLRTALEPSGDWPATAAGTQAYVGGISTRIAEEAVQMHGGMGQSDELAIGHAAKRIMLLGKLFGDDATGLLDYARAA